MKIDDDWTGDGAWYLVCASGNPHDWRGDACIACGIPAPAMAPFRPMSAGYVGPDAPSRAAGDFERFLAWLAWGAAQ